MQKTEKTNVDKDRKNQVKQSPTKRNKSDETPSNKTNTKNGKHTLQMFFVATKHVLMLQS